MPTPDEKRALDIIDEEGGECSELKVSQEIGLRLVYIRTILNSMGRRDYVDVLKGGKVRIAHRGWKALGKQPKFLTPWESLANTDEKIPLTPEERYKKWTGQKTKDEEESESLR
ncbi:MAG: hypothetical protein KAX20_00410 [Candidatus Omnitrophica bacterium]|nr:hypothetical protein [Candidatus Omnitrophota bacterium]